MCEGKKENIAMALTKTDFMRGMQCPKMLWLDKHKPSLKFRPPEFRNAWMRAMTLGKGIEGPGEVKAGYREMVDKANEGL